MDELFQTNKFHDSLVQVYHPHMKVKELFNYSFDLLIVASAPMTSYSSWSLIFWSWFSCWGQKEGVGNRAVFHLWSGSLNLSLSFLVIWMHGDSFGDHPDDVTILCVISFSPTVFVLLNWDNPCWQKDPKLKYRSPRGPNVSEHLPSMGF